MEARQLFRLREENNKHAGKVRCVVPALIPEV